MIGYLRGILMAREEPSLLLIDVNGVGYEVMVSQNTYCQSPPLNDPIQVLIHMVVREDAQLLFGFLQESERQLFRILIKVSGVGPKLALAILSGIEPHQFISCVHQKDTTRLTRISGVGKKTAERLIIETRDALADWQFLPAEHNNNLVSSQASQQPLEDAISALTALGYKPNDAKVVIRSLSNLTQNTEELIRLALQRLSNS